MNVASQRNHEYMLRVRLRKGVLASLALFWLG